MRSKPYFRIPILALICVVGGLALPSTVSAQAVNYSPIRFDLGLSVPYAHGPGSSGIGGYFEVKYNLLDQLGVGMRFDGVAMLGGNVEGGGTTQTLDARAVATALVKAEYFFMDSTFRPFVGLGLGLYYFAAESVTAGPDAVGISQIAGEYFGMAPQVGIDLGAFRFSIVYNVIIGASMEVSQTVGTGVAKLDSVSQNYLTLEIGFRIGGGRRAAPPPHSEERSRGPAHPVVKPVGE